MYIFPATLLQKTFTFASDNIIYLEIVLSRRASLNVQVKVSSVIFTRPSLSCSAREAFKGSQVKGQYDKVSWRETKYYTALQSQRSWRSQRGEAVLNFNSPSTICSLTRTRQLGHGGDKYNMAMGGQITVEKVVQLALVIIQFRLEMYLLFQFEN